MGIKMIYNHYQQESSRKVDRIVKPDETCESQSSLVFQANEIVQFVHPCKSCTLHSLFPQRDE